MTIEYRPNGFFDTSSLGKLLIQQETKLDNIATVYGIARAQVMRSTTYVLEKNGSLSLPVNDHANLMLFFDGGMIIGTCDLRGNPPRPIGFFSKSSTYGASIVMLSEDEAEAVIKSVVEVFFAKGQQAARDSQNLSDTKQKIRQTEETLQALAAYKNRLEAQLQSAW